MTTDARARQMLLRRPIKTLAEEAEAERAHLTFGSDEWEFYRGVEAAAMGVLYPDRLIARPATWLDLEAPAFRNGYLAALASLEAAMIAEQPRTRLPLPQP